MTVLEGD